jgi:tRNA/tmRNA/rRNA uracil-C5-methylase (TrmA/RlmC/RlmD family)
MASSTEGDDVGVSWLVIVNAGPFLRRNQLTALLAPSCPPPLAVHKRTGQRHTCAYLAFSNANLDAALAAFPLARGGSEKSLRVRRAARGEVPRDALSLLAPAPAPAFLPPAPLQQPLPDVHSVVTPLAHVPYAAQCARKACDMHLVLERVAAGLAAAGAGGSGGGGGQKRQREEGVGLSKELGWLPAAQAAHGGAVCALAPLLPSPVVEGYRNKAEFTIGFDAGGAPGVGFCLGSFSATGGEVRVAGAPSFRHLPPQLCALRAAAEAWLRASPLPPYDTRSHQGVWRSLTVRWCADQRGAMVELVAKPPPPPAPPPPAAGEVASGEGAGEDAVGAGSGGATAASSYAAEVARFEALLRGVSGEGSSSAALPAVASLWLLEYGGCSVPDANAPRRLLFGAPHITEALPLSGLRFRVSPGAFSQVNTSAADELYVLVRALAVDGEKGACALLACGEGAAAAGDAGGGGGGNLRVGTLRRGVLPTVRPSLGLLDVCCGGGVFSLLCAPFVGATLGMDISAEAVRDAASNAALNGFATGKCTFVCAKAEEVLVEGAQPLAPLCSFVAVVDPPRGGLHPGVIRTLRAMAGLRRVVYVSCAPAGSFVVDAVRLCEPSKKGFRGAPFRPVFSVPLDLFPHTPGVELVTLFERDCDERDQ